MTGISITLVAWLSKSYVKNVLFSNQTTSLSLEHLLGADKTEFFE